MLKAMRGRPEASIDASGLFDDRLM